MTAQAIAVIGAVVGLIARVVVAAGLRGGWATFASFGVSAFVVWVWSLSNGGIHAANAWDYLKGYAVVLISAAGAFHVIENVPKADDAVNRLVGK